MHQNFQGFAGTPRNLTFGAAKFRQGYQCHRLLKSNRLRRRRTKAQTRKASEKSEDVPKTSTSQATAWNRHSSAETASNKTAETNEMGVSTVGEPEKAQYGHNGEVDKYGRVPPKPPVQQRPVATKPAKPVTRKPQSGKDSGRSTGK
jgi:hypothetical protein